MSLGWMTKRESDGVKWCVNCARKGIPTRAARYVDDDPLCDDCAVAQGETTAVRADHHAIQGKKRKRIPVEDRRAICRAPGNVSTASLARKYGISEPTVAKMRRASGSPVVPEIVTLDDALDVLEAALDDLREISAASGIRMDSERFVCDLLCRAGRVTA